MDTSDSHCFWDCLSFPAAILAKSNGSPLLRSASSLAQWPAPVHAQVDGRIGPHSLSSVHMAGSSCHAWEWVLRRPGGWMSLGADAVDLLSGGAGVSDGTHSVLGDLGGDCPDTIALCHLQLCDDGDASASACGIGSMGFGASSAQADI